MRTKVAVATLMACLFSFPTSSQCLLAYNNQKTSSGSKPSTSSKPTSSRPSSSSTSKYSAPKPPTSTVKPTPPKSTFSNPSVNKPTTQNKYSAPKTTPPTTTKPSTIKPITSTPPVNKYSTPNTKPVTPPVTNNIVSTKPNASSKPASSNFDAQAAEAQKREASRQKYIASQPKEFYKDNKGVTQKIDVNKPVVQDIRRMDYNTYSTRQDRAKKVYGPTIYNNYNTTVVNRPAYRDPYSDLFMAWLITRSINDQAMWYYSHRNDMDRARWDSAMRDNAELRARVSALEQQKANVPSNYVPAGVDKDLMYNDDYVAAVYNPTPVNDGSTSALKIFLIVSGFIVVITLVVWAVFLKDWKVN